MATLPPRYQPVTQSVIPGGFGSVQRVRDTFLDRVVLFKSMQDKAHNDQLVNEVRALSKARSRHVVEIYDVIRDTDASVTGIIIELLEGRDFKDFHTTAAKDVDGYVRVLYQISVALCDLHRAGIVHRDLKLENFKESTAGILKLFDFGISVDDEDYRTVNNRGTLVYAAPELFVKGTAITPAMDIYALGACAWALAANTWPPVLTEKPPQLTGRAPSIGSVLPGLPANIVTAIDACLAPDPALRPIAEDISSLLARYLVRGTHRGVFVQGSAALYELSSAQPFVRIKIGSLGEIEVRYDGLTFRIERVTGAVFVNNRTASVNTELHEACVLTFGDPSLGSARQWVSFSSSHPEVIL